jgi:hypothetical protein
LHPFLYTYHNNSDEAGVKTRFASTERGCIIARLRKGHRFAVRKLYLTHTLLRRGR